MKIKYLKIKNPLEKYKHCDIELVDINFINIFIGKNNSGKTLLLNQVFRVLNQRHDSNKFLIEIRIILNKKDLKNMIDDFNVKLKNVSKISDIVNKLLKYADFESKLDFLSLSFKKNSNNFSIEYLIDPVFKVRRDFIYIERFLSIIKENQDYINILFDVLLPINRVKFLPSIRVLGPSIKNYDRKNFQEINQVLKSICTQSFRRLEKTSQNEIFFFVIPDLALILSFIKNREISEDLRLFFTEEFFEKFNNNLNKIFPELEISIDLQVSDLSTQGGYKEYNRLIGDWQQLGHGTRQLISLIFLLMIPGNFIYLIDEPEIGLHPGLQIKFLNFIKNEAFSNNQYTKMFFFATQSTSFIDFRGNCSHYICKKDSEDFNVDLVDENQFDMIRSELELLPSSLLQSNGIIWVEGPTDRYYLESFFRTFNFDPEKEGILIVLYNGKGNLENEHFSLEIFESLNPNFIVMVDSDFTDKKRQHGQKLLKVKEKFEDAEHLFWIIESATDIEGFIPQEVLDDFFKIKERDSELRIKDRFEKLEEYISSIKKNNITPINVPKFNKVRNAKSITKLIESKPKFISLIKKDIHIKNMIETFLGEIKKWTTLEIESIPKIDKKSAFDFSPYVKYSIEDLIHEYHRKDQKDDIDTETILLGLKKYGARAMNVLLDEFYMGNEEMQLTAELLLEMLDPDWREKFPETKEGFVDFSTPQKTADYMISRLKNVNKADKFLDPCVGNGNIVKSLLKINLNPNQIYAFDIDGKYQDKIQKMGVNFYQTDTLLALTPQSMGEFDFIIMNPPIMPETSEYFQNNRKTFKKLYAKIDSYHTNSMFIINSIWRLKEGGMLVLITSDLILTAKYNKTLREFILNNCVIEEILRAPEDLFKNHNIHIKPIIMTLIQCTGEENLNNRSRNLIKIIQELKSESDYEKDLDFEYIFQYNFYSNPEYEFELEKWEDQYDNEIKLRIIELLKRYIASKNNHEKEREIVLEFGSLFDENQKELEILGFNYKSKDVIRYYNFNIHFTRNGIDFIYQFLIRQVDKRGELLKPDVVFFSEMYPEYQKVKNNIGVIIDFIENLKLSL